MNGQMVTARVIYMIEYGTVKNILKFLPFCKEYKEWEYLKKCPASHQLFVCVFLFHWNFLLLKFLVWNSKRWRQFQNIFFSSVVRTLSNHIWPFLLLANGQTITYLIDGISQQFLKSNMVQILLFLLFHLSTIKLLLYHFSIYKSLCMWLGQEDDGRTRIDLQNLTCKR